MKVINTTKYNTKDLRTLFYRCVKEVEKVEKPNFTFKDRKDIFTLQFNNSNRGMSGRATINGYWILIKIPDGELDKIRLARYIIHEYYHTIGFRNFDYHHYKFDRTKDWNVDWVNDYLIGLKEIKPKVKVDIQRVRYERALNNLNRAMTKFKRSQTILNKWKNKVKYYQVVLAKKEEK